MGFISNMCSMNWMIIKPISLLMKKLIKNMRQRSGVAAIRSKLLSHRKYRISCRHVLIRGYQVFRICRIMGNMQCRELLSVSITGQTVWLLSLVEEEPLTNIIGHFYQPGSQVLVSSHYLYMLRHLIRASYSHHHCTWINKYMQ